MLLFACGVNSFGITIATEPLVTKWITPAYDHFNYKEEI